MTHTNHAETGPNITADNPIFRDMHDIMPDAALRIVRAGEALGRLLKGEPREGSLPARAEPQAV